MMINLLDFKFKGDREYIHGTDFYSHIVSGLSSFKLGYLSKLQFKKFTDKQCSLILGANANNSDVIAEGLWKSGSRSINFYIIEKNEPVIERYFFDEDGLVSSAKFLKDSISNSFNSKFSLIENIVALTKNLHCKLFPSQKGRWVFAQISLRQALPNQCKEIYIYNTHHLANKFTKNKIHLDGDEIGEIRFIVAN